jgi:hypothetical protein
MNKLRLWVEIIIKHHTMERINLNKQLTISKYKTNKEKELAIEIWKYFNKNLSISIILSLMKRKGYRSIYMIYQDIKKNCPYQYKLFMHKIKLEKIIYN